MQRDISVPETEEALAAAQGLLDVQAGPFDPPSMAKPADALWGVPAVFPRMRWAGQTLACPAERVVGVTLVAADGSRMRFAIDVEELRAMAARITFYRPPQGEGERRAS